MKKILLTALVAMTLFACSNEQGGSNGGNQSKITRIHFGS